MFGSTYRKGGTEIYIVLGKLPGILVRFGLGGCSFFCIYNLCIFKVDFKALIVMQMLKQKRSYIKQNLHCMAKGGRGDRLLG